MHEELSVKLLRRGCINRVKASDVAQVEAMLPQSGGSTNGEATQIAVGMLISDPVHRRLIESASTNLALGSSELDPDTIQVAQLAEYELIIADESIARRVKALLAATEERADRIHPAVVAIRRRDIEVPEIYRTVPTAPASRADQEFDAVLSMPIEPGPAAVQLSLILYAQRAFVRRYHSALEELHLNRRIFSSVTSGISVANASGPDMPLVYVNPAFEIMTGYSLEEVQGKNCRFLQGAERDQPGLTVLREALEQNRETVAILRNYRKDGSAFWNELSLSPIRNREGEVTHFVGIQTDVTARVEFEAALRESEKLAAVGRLASSIAHEINNPLEAVMNLLYLANKSDDLNQARDFVVTAEQELKRVALITSQSLRFYKQSSRPQAITGSGLLGSVLDLYEVRLRSAHIAVERRERLTQSFVCLESEIRQVLNNLIKNALDAMIADGGRLIIRSREATEWRGESKGILITIADTGSGISPETMKNIYKAFFTTKGIGGTGLGLWISSEIVERHQGRLRVRSSQDRKHRGTVFQLFLPYQGIAA